MSGYLVPAPYTGMSSRDAHLRRNPPSSEPGTDYYMPTGTPLLAPADCRIVAIGGSVTPATGRFVTFDDGTRWARFLHMLDWVARPGDELAQGDLMGISGASGYGSEFFGEPERNDAFWRNTGGDHVHVTLFRGRAYTFGSSGTIDFHALTGGQVAGGGGAPFEPTALGDDMSFAMKVVDDPQRGPVECAVGFRPNPLNDEEFANYYGGRAFTCNARQYDVNLARHARLIPAASEGIFLGKGTSPDRPWTLFAPGYMFPYVGAGAAELLDNQPFATQRLAGNDRQYDLWAAQALRGEMPVVDAAVDLTGLKVEAIVSDADIAEIASASREAFRRDPLK